MGIKFDYSFEEAQRLAALEEELGEIGGGGSAIGGWAQSQRRHNEAIAALHAFGEAIAAIVRSSWCPECLGTRLVVIAGNEEDCDRCDAQGVIRNPEDER